MMRALLKKWTVPEMLACVAMLLLATGIDVVVYQSWLRPIAAEVRFFALTLHAGVLALVIAMLVTLARERLPRLRIPSGFLFGLIILFLGFCSSFLGATDLCLHGGVMLQWVSWLLCLWWLTVSAKHRSAAGMGLLVAALFTSVLGLLQVLHQGSLGLSLLGEASFGLDVAGTSKIALDKLLLVRGYGLFPHPNIAFGWIALGLLAFFRFVPKFHPLQRPELTLFLSVLGMGLLATGSKSLLLLLGAVIGVLWFRDKSNRALWMPAFVLLTLSIGAVAMDIWQTDTWTDRVYFLQAAWQSVLAHPLGVGLSHSAAALHSAGEMSPWMLQPVHTIYGLLFQETGIIGGLGWLVVWIASVMLLHGKVAWPTAAAVLYVGLSGLFDHFWLTYPPTFLLLALVFADLLAHHLAKGTGRSYNKV